MKKKRRLLFLGKNVIMKGKFKKQFTVLLLILALLEEGDSLSLQLRQREHIDLKLLKEDLLIHMVGYIILMPN